MYRQNKNDEFLAGCAVVIGALFFNILIWSWLIMLAVSGINTVSNDCTLKPFLIPHVVDCEDGEDPA